VPFPLNFWLNRPFFVLMPKDPPRASRALAWGLVGAAVVALAKGYLPFLARFHAGDLLVAIALLGMAAWAAKRTRQRLAYERALLERMGELESSLGRSYRTVSKERRRADHLASLSITDELTGLYNRRGFMLLAEQHLRLAARAQTHFAVLFADLNGLKSINDTRGHKAGDQAIRDVSRVLKHTLRESDIVARLGGDEFIALVSIPSAPAVQAVARRIHNAIAEENARAEDEPLSVSLGEAMFDPSSQRTLSELISEADRRMYERKIERQRLSGAESIPALRVVRSA